MISKDKKRIEISVPIDIYKMLEEISNATGETKSELIVEFITPNLRFYRSTLVKEAADNGAKA